ncbi:helix-turn-helix transcriptional regulator [Brevibacillus laterosporus]|uniref:YafY family protein n=1 Tax=Brevibacillus laterosporus TaxID=1465 RepID=A0AAP3GBP0_BRELA|nr:YafY family protein [Brevibacillus laterosporus]MCR8980130.1 YafY family transcriptional regulator [Brevibacillus laterosporus]MCZ0807285.1 YafY family protein [Brevibacillus laterosporus]MCZ0825606.1 YafY family protein [Brevibacillus laterosporus]MCZ0849384.1 YafY family protein [Brevibacillus laterosporus]
MNKMDRMLAIVLELQRRGTARAEDLAATFETSVRTIYRDVQALSEAGVPLIGTPGQGYSLMEGYFLPPIQFTPEEAVTLLVGTEFVERYFDQAYLAKARTSKSKIESILPEKVRREVEKARADIRLLMGKIDKARSKEMEHMSLLRRAIADMKKVRFSYVKATTTSHEKTARTADPYGLLLVNGSWVLLAFCELRQSIRHFRLSRMQELVLEDKEFERPDDFKLHTYVPPDNRHLFVQILLDPCMAERLEEENYYYVESVEEQEQGLLVTLRIRHYDEIVSWILSWGSDVRVIQPEGLKQRVLEEIQKMLQHY